MSDRFTVAADRSQPERSDADQSETDPSQAGQSQAERSQAEQARRYSRHMLSELHFRPAWDRLEAGEVYGEAEVTPYMHVPGAPHLRTSILAMWSDMLGGILSLAAMRPRAGVTLELDVHLYRPAPSCGVVRASGRTVKAGRTVHVAHAEFSDSAGEPFAFSTSSFMASPTSHPAPSLSTSTRAPASPPPRLSVPLASRAALLRSAPGVATMPLSPHGLNGIGTMHGGLIALVAEESILALALAGSTVSSLELRYLSPVRVGPATATASGRDGLWRSELRDTGNEDRLAALATARTFRTS